MDRPVEPLPTDMSADAFSSATPEVTDWLAILNPAAGRGRTLHVWSRMEQALRAAAVRCDVVTTSNPGAGRELACAAIHAGRTHIIVAGGDGSVHDVVNGIMLARGTLIGPAPTLVALPLGTGNDWSRSLGLPVKLRPGLPARCVARAGSVPVTRVSAPTG